MKRRPIKRGMRNAEHGAKPELPRVGCCKAADVEICVLAGGLSSRMGRDKARLRLGRFMLLGRIQAEARKLGRPVRVIRRDLVPRCGPLGGIYTAFQRGRSGAVLFLSCDMPYVSVELLQWVLKQFGRGRRAVFLKENGVAGFPFVVRRGDLPAVERQLARKIFSIQKLAAALGVKLVSCPRKHADELMNVNTPEDWEKATEKFKAQNSKFKRSSGIQGGLVGIT